MNDDDIKRQDECSEAIQKVLADLDCDLIVFVQVGESVRPLSSVLGLPMVLNVVVKEIANANHGI